MTYRGGCHCGKIGFELDGELTKIIECNCSHCSKKGFLLAFFPRSALRLTTPEADIATYTFNKHRIQHHFCPTCGCAPFADGTDQNGAATAAVNVRCVEDVDVAALEIMKVDGRSY